MSDTVKELLDVPRDFAKEGTRFIQRCTKPSRKEFNELSYAVARGFLIVGFIGYFVKLIHIPINHLLVGGALKLWPF